MFICGVSSCLALMLVHGCTSIKASASHRCETSLAAVVASPVKHIGKLFCGEAIVTAGQNLAFAAPLERPDLRPEELAIMVLTQTDYEKVGLVTGKRYRVRLDGKISGNASCFVRAEDVCAPYERQLFMLLDQLKVLGPA